MWGPIYWPDGFVPEEYGWVSAAPYIGGRLEEEMRMWMRWQVPFLSRACLARLVHPESGKLGFTYMGPVNGEFPEAATPREVYAEVTRRI